MPIQWKDGVSAGDKVIRWARVCQITASAFRIPAVLYGRWCNLIFLNKSNPDSSMACLTISALRHCGSVLIQQKLGFWLWIFFHARTQERYTWCWEQHGLQLPHNHIDLTGPQSHDHMTLPRVVGWMGCIVMFCILSQFTVNQELYVDTQTLSPSSKWDVPLCLPLARRVFLVSTNFIFDTLHFL